MAKNAITRYRTKNTDPNSLYIREAMMSEKTFLSDITYFNNELDDSVYLKLHQMFKKDHTTLN